MAYKNIVPYVAILVVGFLIGAALTRIVGKTEGFVDVTQSTCQVCARGREECCNSSCNGCPNNGDRKTCPQIDWSKYVLKSSVPPCPPQPDMSRYMLKTECPAPPDMSKYVLKSAVPPCPPCITTCNKPCKIGECPPGTPPRGPVVQCPEPKACPPCAPVEPPRCPEPKVTCKTDYVPEEPWMVRPLLASISPM
jgi:hypothetical protein